MTKNWQKITTENFIFLFWSKTAIYLSLGLHNVCPSYRRSLQLSKRPSNTSKHELLPIFFYFCGSFLPSWIRIRIPNTDPDPDPETRLNTDPIRIRIRIHNPDRRYCIFFSFFLIWKGEIWLWKKSLSWVPISEEMWWNRSSCME